MVTIILFAPLVGAVLCGFGYRWLGEKGGDGHRDRRCCSSRACSAWIVFFSFDGVTQQPSATSAGSSRGRWRPTGAYRLDRLTAIMLVVVTTVSALVHLYSFGYMDHDENFKHGESYKPRFFAYLSFFTFAMLALVTADNLLQLFFGWEGVGVASYLLIGFYYRKPSANAAAIKAFIVNRVGDFGFLLGIFALYVLVDFVDLDRHLRRGAEPAADADQLPLARVERGRGGRRCCSSSARWASRRSSSCTPGCRTRWKARRRSRR